MQDRWITDSEPSSRFPIYTRGNADEVGPEPFSPLGWDLGWRKGCLPGVAAGFASFGVLDVGEFEQDPPEVFGNWGGYFYNVLSLSRLMGARMPGATPEAIDQAYFGDQPGIPPYVAHPDDESPEHTAKLEQTMAWVMGVSGPYDRQEEAAVAAAELVAGRPDLTSVSDAELVARARQAADVIAFVWDSYCEVALGASLPSGAVQAVCDALGRPEDAVKLMTAVGGIDSADTGRAIWRLSRLVHNSTDLTAEFDAGVVGLHVRLKTSEAADAAVFLAALNDVLAEHGHRGPNEWDMMSHSWQTRPDLALTMVERIRLQDDDHAPELLAPVAAAERERLAVELLALVEGDAEAHGTLAAGIAASGLFFGYRERGKNITIKVIHEAKLAVFELGRRMVKRGVIDEIQQVFMLLDGELDEFIVDPDPLRGTIQQRWQEIAELRELEPPYIIRQDEPVPPISEWPRRGESDAEPAGLGEVLQGAAGSPGVATGVARIVMDPFDPMALGPDEIMIAPTTDPSWTPLFMTTAAVVCNVGAVASHAAIVSRELGVPCAVSVVDATSRIPDGATVTVDGSSGTVTIEALP
jgi:phosphohistidine swiveling domain-containing protein